MCSNVSADMKESFLFFVFFAFFGKVGVDTDGLLFFVKVSADEACCAFLQ